MRNGDNAYAIMRSLSLGITNRDLGRIPVTAGETGDKAFARRLKGHILLAVEAHGEAWYVNPLDGRRYYLKDGPSAYELLRRFGLGIKNQDLKQIAINPKQIAFDGTFESPAYVVMNGTNTTASEQGDVVLPLASLTKIMTALVLADLTLDWERTVTVTADEIAYPRQLVGDDTTSEVELKEDDIVALKDLWICMLVASSNQAAVALVDASGLSRADFIARMNERVQALGLSRTIFVDVTGLDAHNLSTAREMAVIARAAFSIPDIAAATNQTSHTFSVREADGVTRAVSIRDRNHSLRAFGPDAVKTGYLVEAKNNAALLKGERVVVVLHAATLNARNTIVGRLLREGMVN